MKRKGLFLLLAALLLTALSACGAAKEEMCVRVLDVGKADAILITAGGRAVLMDTGTKDAREDVLDALDRWGVTELDALILTHFDKDHIGSAEAVLEHVRVARIYQPDYVKDSGTFEDYQEALASYSGEVCTVTEETAFSTGGMEFVLLPPEDTAAPRSSNECSLVTELYYGDTSFLLPGDAAGERLEELLAQDIGSFDVLKVPHHGKADENSAALIAMVAPEYAVLTVPDEEYADTEVLAALYAAGARVQCTCDGTVLYCSDGARVRARTEAAA